MLHRAQPRRVKIARDWKTKIFVDRRNRSGTNKSAKKRCVLYVDYEKEKAIRALRLPRPPYRMRLILSLVTRTYTNTHEKTSPTAKSKSQVQHPAD